MLYKWYENNDLLDSRDDVKIIRGQNMKNATGEIVSSQITKMPSSNLRYGYVTIETPDNRYLKVKVDVRTKYDTLEKGERVTVEYDVMGKTDILSAKKIMKNQS
jgi:hypothetical protein